MASLRGVLHSDRGQTSRLSHNVMQATLTTRTSPATQNTEASLVLTKSGNGTLIIRRGSQSVCLTWCEQEMLTPGLDVSSGALAPALYVTESGERSERKVYPVERED